MRIKKEHRWNDEGFLRRACDQMTEELNWDSLDSGCLHLTFSTAETLDGRHVVIAVVNIANIWGEVLRDVEDERQNARWPASTPIWIYVPEHFDVPEEITKQVIIRHVSNTGDDLPVG